MAEVKADRRPTRDYPSLSESPWPLWDLMFTRRSCRKYVPGSLGEGLVRDLEELVSLSLETRGARPGGMIAVTDPEVGERLKRRSYKGFANKINLWLSRAPVHAFLVIAVPDEDVGSERPRELPLVSMAVEDCVLWLTGRGLGTCWLGGVNSEEVKDVLDLDPTLNVPAVVCIGAPRSAAKTLSLDNFMLNTMSRRRKPLGSIAYSETMLEAYSPADISAGGFRAAAEQDIPALLQVIGIERAGAGVPVELAVEACLEAARIAPSASNSQAWHFVVVRDADRLGELARACGETDQWSAAIVAAGEPSTFSSGVLEKPFWMFDVPIATSHMSLMAASMGCGVRVYTDRIDERAVNSLAQLKPGKRTVTVLGIDC